MSADSELLRMAVVTGRNGSKYEYKIKFDGDTAEAQKYYKSTQISISTGTRVLCARVSGTWIIIGKI